MGKKKKVEVPPPDSPKWQNQSPFRVAERSWKRLDLPPALLDSLVNPAGDFGAALQAGTVRTVNLAADPRSQCSEFGQPVSPCHAYAFTDVPGLLLLRGVFAPEAQVKAVQACLSEFAMHPNVTNLDTHYFMPAGGLWEQAERERAGLDTSPLERRHDGNVPDVGAYEVKLATAEQDGAASAAPGSVRIDPPTTATPRLKHSLPASEALKRLRWASLGYQYNWATNTYHLDRKVAFPRMIDEMTAAVVGAVTNLTGYSRDQWKSEAGIINFYQLGDALMAHQDRSEENVLAPLISFRISFGNSCIYLIGSDTRDVAPTPIVLQSGDMLVMHGSARRAFHSVPRILEHTLPEYLTPPQVLKPGWESYYNYLKNARININVRQVF
ncbi:2OG-Fe(II) oxygenase superfamily-domain-containing protein [Geranomyces variabilis]|nr:2OG-Fe(II) oxygenase superfamily-domain-containing protein [Geranomyces variabilis]KAJ3138066.1 hypothetical protein HDU90_001542 [Geranomyces variabilis]